MKRISVFIFIVCLSGLFLHRAMAQDVHFSQNYATPLFINPAMTGLINGDVRVAAVYRNQWAAIMPGVSFRTVTASADMNFPGVGENDHLAAGLLLYNDRAGDLNWATNYLDAAFAYNLGLAPETYLSVGLQGGINQRNFDLANAQFGDQSDGTGFNPNLPTTDVITAESRLRFHAGAGAMFYRAFSARKNVFLGAAIYHLNKPDIAVTDAEDRFKTKLSVQGGGSIQLSEKWDLLPSAYYIMQGPHFKADVGTFVRYVLASNRYTGYDKAFNIGAWLRAGSDVDKAMGLNALVIAGKIDYENFSLGVSYDLTLFSGLNNANNGRGGAEIALIYNGRLRPSRPGALNCPRF